jgi:hypothetical protein
MERSMVFLPFVLLPATVLANLGTRAVRFFQLTVDERDHRQDVERALFGHVPLGFWSVGERVADRTVKLSIGAPNSTSHWRPKQYQLVRLKALWPQWYRLT